MSQVRFALVRVPPTDVRLDLVSFAGAAGMHPELVLRLVALGLLEPERDRLGRPCFGPEQLARAARIQRLRAGLSLNYAALGLVIDLLDRVAELESALRRFESPGVRSGGWNVPRSTGG